MTPEQQKQYFLFLNTLRDNTLSYLPVADYRSSRIHLDLLIYLACHLGDKVTVKQLLASVPHSDAGIRTHFEALLRQGLIELKNSPKDRRVRYVKVTPKMNKVFTAWAESGIKLLKDIPF